MTDRKQQLEEAFAKVVEDYLINEQYIDEAVKELIDNLERLYPEVSADYVPDDEEMAFYRLAAARAERLQEENAEMRKRLLEASSRGIDVRLF